MLTPKEAGGTRWKPLDTQAEFLSLDPWAIYEALFGGAVGGGKTDSLLVYPINLGWHLHPTFKGIIFRPSYPQLEKEIIPRSRPLYDALGGTYNAQSKRWTFPSGASILFGHGNDMKQAQNYDGTEFQFIAFDELQQFREDFYLYLLSRGRSGHKGTELELPVIVRNSAMPGGIGQKWVFERFIKWAPGGKKIKQDTVEFRGKTKKISRIFIPSRLEHNIHVNEEYAFHLHTLPEKERQAKLLGDWNAIAGEVFTEFRPVRLPGEPPNAIHVVDRFPIPTHWPKLLAVDPGYRANTFAGWFAWDPKERRLYMYREYAEKQQLTSTWARHLARLSKNDGPNFHVVLDAAAWDKTGEKHTTAQIFQQHFGRHANKADKSRVDGKLNIQEYLRWKPKPIVKEVQGVYDPQKAMDLYRTKGARAALDYEEAMRTESDETNLPKLQILNRSPEGKPIEEIVEIVRTRIYDDKNTEDVMETEDDDGYDMLRYGINYAIRHFEPLPIPSKREEAIRNWWKKVPEDEYEATYRHHVGGIMRYTDEGQARRDEPVSARLPSPRRRGRGGRRSSADWILPNFPHDSREEEVRERGFAPDSELASG